MDGGCLLGPYGKGRSGMNHPGVSRDSVVCELSWWLGLVVSVVGRLQFGRGDVAAVLVRSAMVEPVDPFGGGELDLVRGAPRSAGFDELGLVEPVDRFGQGVIERLSG